jgi:drug/metabolite transporter superfamily protein YnfA
MSVGSLEVHGGRTAALGGHFVAHLLAFVEAVETRTLDGADVDEHVLAAVAGLNETEPLGGVEPLHSALSHSLYPS